MNYVVLGASAAGINAAKTLRELDKDSNIVVISKDENIYSRCMLHHVISEHRTLKQINFVDEDFMEKNNINWISGKTVKGIDTDKKLVQMEDIAVNYDKLLIATGASSAIPPIKNLREGNFVYSVRNIDDIYKIKEKAEKSKKVVIIGAGLVGIDALIGLFKYEQLDISVAFMEKYILDRQLDEYTASVYENKFKEKGVKFYPSASIQEIVLDDSKDVKGVAFSNGEILDADMVIVATGVKPNADFLDETGIEYDRGIIIDDRCQTTQKDIYAAGDVVGKNAIWPIAVKQGIIAAHNMVGKDKKVEDEFAFKNSMNFMDIPTISIGMNTPVDDSYKVLTRHGNDCYKKFIFKDNIIYGAVIQGDISYVGVLTYLIKNKVEISDLENRIFDVCYADFFNIKENGEFCYSV
ncbi:MULTISPECIES: NAD(P)/FAD-dependent oxidoreductase [unclassified Clostridioides]|uniref:NAD(P)/FAD-dependent oxidoreductase n=1 Tax=unclassified Clostridioides TaxID=2635829 RepID=UPI001D0C474D|nr:NAD(P)/FAD-dependent oxidoreductase [Clostridioides sp. ES-S-0001-03]MCC0674154.1 NAD(P)/FAD-dependent oxidoreductase [Clostridioides sp. ES-S-0145-01]MCC0681730.1 NAD(P)/FAD-dependent oxidoreductase [Clostridioides sp. ES-S-0005-03]MCC0695895.1 NAD(P)/FAD-dependent oxidoreductase [Clostridioides sp. ES-S-0048-02]MCC0703731.1 NAD(P)/FAD-dependent oxidoreductase [Clostridioides sp. ES-S-0049-02]MCC0708845.1 NAD(P)/FAD-dependent oxidoreductase [Clostridioides sp. ES-S-0190-01]MCC0763560.1 NA